MKTKTLQVRIEPDKINELKLRAEALGMSVSEYVRYLFEMDTNKPDTAEAIVTHGKALSSIIKKLNAQSVSVYASDEALRKELKVE